MSLTQFTPSFMQSPERPPCPDCGGKMTLVTIEPHAQGVDQRAFQCKECGYPEEILFDFR